MPIASSQRRALETDVWQGLSRGPYEAASSLAVASAGWPIGEPVPRVDSVTAQVTDLGVESLGSVRDLVKFVGRDVAAAYAGFAVCALFLTFAQTANEATASKSTLLGVLNGLDGSSGGFGWLLVLAALGSIAVPRWWKHPCAVLCAVTPLLVTLYGDFRYAEAQVRVAYVVTKAMLDRASSLFGTGALSADMLTQSTALDPYRIGIGAYATLILSAYIALRCAQRFGRPA